MISRTKDSTIALTLSLNLIVLNGVIPTCALGKDAKKASQKEAAASAKTTQNFGFGKPQDAKFDSADRSYKLTAEQTLNLEIINPQSDWNKVYSIGRAAYIDGDYRRAFNAFKLAMIKAKAQGITDGRMKQTEEAFKSVQARASSLDARLGFKLEAKNRAKIDKVFPGSLAWLAGIKADDKIVAMQETGNVTKLSLSRNGRLFSATITDRQKPVAPDFSKISALAPRLDGQSDFGISQQITDTRLLAANEKLLANHDLVALIDKSSSMGGTFLNTGVSQWDWCKSQWKDFLDLGKYFPSGITIVPFDSQYTVLSNMHVANIGGVFQNYSPSGGTHLAEPFWDQLSRYFAGPRNKPILIVVISDFGTAGEQVREGVFEAARRVRSQDEMVICLLEVGLGGRRLVAALDNEMTSVGAPYDIVDATTSEDLVQIGIKNALVAALLKRQPAAAPKEKPKK